MRTGIVPGFLAGALAGGGVMFGWGLWVDGHFAPAAYSPSRVDPAVAGRLEFERRARCRVEAENWTLRAAEFRQQCRAADLEAEAEELRGLLLGPRAEADTLRRERTRPQADPGPDDLIPPAGVPTGRE